MKLNENFDRWVLAYFFLRIVERDALAYTKTKEEGLNDEGFKI